MTQKESFDLEAAYKRGYIDGYVVGVSATVSKINRTLNEAITTYDSLRKKAEQDYISRTQKL